MQIFLAAAEAEIPGLLPLGFPMACLGCDLGEAFPAGTPRLPGGALVLGGPLRASAAGPLAEECRRRSVSAAVLGFGDAPALDTLRLCDQLRRRRITPILAEEAWRPGCDGAALCSTALSGGSFQDRVSEALTAYGGVALDLERTRRAFPLPCPDGEGQPLSAADFDALKSQGGEHFFTEALQCQSFLAETAEGTRMVLYDDVDTVCRKTALAASLGAGWAFLLAAEWDEAELRALRAGLEGL